MAIKATLLALFAVLLVAHVAARCELLAVEQAVPLFSHTVTIIMSKKCKRLIL